MNPEVLSAQNSFFVTFVASLLIWLMFIGVGILWFIDGKIKKEQALHAIFSIIIAGSIVYLIKTLFPTLRPFQFDGRPPLTLTIPGDGSFPSNHAAISFALAVSVYLHNKKAGLFFITCAILISAGRIFSNVHSISDVVVGSLIGIAVAHTIQKLHLFKALR